MRPEKEEVMAFIKPEPVSEVELAGMEKLEPGDYEIYSERLNMILAECKEVFIRVAISNWPGAGDLVVAVHNAQGDMASSCLGTFIHSVLAQNPIKWIIRNYMDNPSVGVHEGDIFYASDATYGGIHNCDQIAIMPIFFNGELIAWGAYIAFFFTRPPFSLPIFLAALPALVITAMIGLAQDRFVYGKLRHGNRITLLIASIGLSYLLRNAIRLIWGSDLQTYGLPPVRGISFVGLSITPTQIAMVAAGFSGSEAERWEC